MKLPIRRSLEQLHMHYIFFELLLKNLQHHIELQKPSYPRDFAKLKISKSTKRTSKS